MKNIGLILTNLMLIGVLVGCGTTNQESDSLVNEPQAVETSSGEVRLTEDFNDALSIQSQLAVGTLLLEGSELVVDETLAAELLPLWRAAQSLSASDTAAVAEVQAVINQIQDSMSPEQITAIAEMNLTEERLTTLFEEGELSFGQGGFGRGVGENADESIQGSRGGGQFPGGGPGFGGGPGGGPTGGGPGGFQGLDPGAVATNRAEFAGSGAASFQDRAVAMAVVRLLETKTGEVAEDRPGRVFEVVFGVVAGATGLTMEEIQAQTAAGATLGGIVEASGGDVDAVRTALIEALGELPNAADFDIEQMALEWLGLEE